MKFTLSWLKTHLQTQASAQEICDALNSIGFEVESLKDFGQTLAPFVVAQILEAEQHPNADRLRVCKVDTGSGTPLQVVCGAPNARKGLKTVFAAAGMTVPGSGLTLKASAIRGVDSNGMLCSADEMGIAGSSEGILELPEGAPVGVPFAPLLGLDDALIEISVTPNRGDALGIYGIARELAAKGLGTLIAPAKAQINVAFETPLTLKYDFDEQSSLCHGFALRLIRGVKNGPSPDWLKARLEAIGLRSINALVDVTNFLSYDQCRPLHVFDADKIQGGLVVRSAKQGETLHALDGKTYTFEEGMCVIADESRVVSLAGIMGGEESGCDETTTNVLVESALWNALNIARTGRKLGITSDARQRFERGVDPYYMLEGLEKATQLILEMCGGEAGSVIVKDTDFQNPPAIDFPLSEIKRLSGLDIAPVYAKEILGKLGFEIQDNGAHLRCVPPSWRYDVALKADLVEEVVRIAGLDMLPSIALPKAQTIGAGVLSAEQTRMRTVRRSLAALGFLEAMCWSFLSEEDAKLFAPTLAPLRLENPISSDLSCMRPSLLAGLLRAADANAKRGFEHVRLFEVGQAFVSDEPKGQILCAATLRRGLTQGVSLGRHWRDKNAFVDVFDAKADAFASVEAAGFDASKLQIKQGGAAYLHPGRSGSLMLGQSVVGIFGELHPKLAKAMDIGGAFALSEVYLDKLPLSKSKALKTKPQLSLSDFQPVYKDLAFLLDKKTAVGDVVRTLKAKDKALVSAVQVFDVYEGKGVPEGFVSVAFAIELSPTLATLKDAEIDALLKGMVEDVQKTHSGQLRG